jgi:hypothetical protein
MGSVADAGRISCSNALSGRFQIKRSFFRAFRLDPPTMGSTDAAEEPEFPATSTPWSESVGCQLVGAMGGGIMFVAPGVSVPSDGGGVAGNGLAPGGAANGAAAGGWFVAGG